METRRASQKPLTPTMEDYLETIFALSKEKKAIRIKNIAGRMGVKMPTVTNMMKTLSERGLIDYERYEYLTLTEKGAAVGREMQRRHEVLRTFLVDILKVDSDRADGEACKMEHGISPSTLDRLVDFMAFVQMCPRAGATWLEHFEKDCQYEHSPEICVERMRAFSEKFRTKIEEVEDQKKTD